MGQRWILIALGVFVVIIGLGIWLTYVYPPFSELSQVPSPLIKQQLPSPLPHPLPEGITGNGPPSINASAKLAGNFKSFLPLVRQGTIGPCGMSGVAADLASLFLSDPGQRRKNIVCDPRVVAAAQYRADDMQRNRYFSHKDMQGFYANHWVTVYGCKLPSFYPPNDNNVESIALNYVSAREAWNNLLLSDAHKTHILGLHPFYEAQNTYGIGYSDGDWGKVYVILTVPACN